MAFLFKLLLGLSAAGFIYWLFRTFELIDIFSFLFIGGSILVLGFATIAVMAGAQHG